MTTALMRLGAAVRATAAAALSRLWTRRGAAAPAWDLTSLINAADPQASAAEQRLWIARLMEWLRHAPAQALGSATAGYVTPGTPWPVRRVRHLLNVLDAQPELRQRFQWVLLATATRTDGVALLAELGFAERPTLAGELSARLAARWLPASPDTEDGARLFALWLRPEDADWMAALDEASVRRLAALWPMERLPAVLTEALGLLAAQAAATGLSPAMRQRLEPRWQADNPFAALSRETDRFAAAWAEPGQAGLLQAANALRARWDACRTAAESVTAHLAEHGVSVELVHAQDLVRQRCARAELLLDTLLAPARDEASWRLLRELLQVLRERQGLGALLGQRHALLARRLAERSADAGEHYITRDRSEYLDMLRRAAGGGLVIAFAALLKFGIAAMGLGAFWGGFWSGVNYAASFVLVVLLHWTVATKQPAMTAPALAQSLPGRGREFSPEAIESFVDRVAQLTRSQVAGVLGNVLACVPVMLLLHLLWVWMTGHAPLDPGKAAEVTASLSLWGPTAGFAAFTGMILFASSLAAGWLENLFVLHRLESALAWNPRLVALLGAPRAQRWAAWWGRHVSVISGSVVLGMMLGLVPPILAFLGLPMEVRHVTLASGQLAAAAASLGSAVLGAPAFWLAAAGIVTVGVLNIGVSFWLAFRLALRSRGLQIKERTQLAQALRSRMRLQPLTFLVPPREPLPRDEPGDGSA